MEIATVDPGDEFVALGRLVSLAYSRKGAVMDVIFDPPEGRPLLAEHQPSGDLFVLEGPEVKTKRGTKGARKRYGEVNWRERPPKIGRVTIPRFAEGDEFTGLGPLVCVTYESDKSGELTHWFHEFEPELPILAEHADSGALAILGGTYEVTARGIVG